jgi:DNA-binding response OmpR family regulator
VTGYGQESDRVRALAAGFDLHLVKPVRLAEVHSAIEAFAKHG